MSHYTEHRPELADSYRGAFPSRRVPHYKDPPPPLTVPATLGDSLRSKLGHLMLSRHPINMTEKMATPDFGQESSRKRVRSPEQLMVAEDMKSDRPTKRPFAGEYSGEMSSDVSCIFSKSQNTEGGCLDSHMGREKIATPIEGVAPFAEGEDKTGLTVLAEAAASMNYIVESGPLHNATSSDMLEATPTAGRTALLTPPLPKDQQIKTSENVGTPKNGPEDAQNLTPPMSRIDSESSDSFEEGTASPTHKSPAQKLQEGSALAAENPVLAPPAIGDKYRVCGQEDQEMIEAALTLCEFSRAAWQGEEECAREQAACFAPSTSGHAHSGLGKNVAHAGPAWSQRPKVLTKDLSTQEFNSHLDQLPDDSDATIDDPDWLTPSGSVKQTQ